MSVWRCIIVYIVVEMMIMTGVLLVSCNENPKPIVEPTSIPKRTNSGETSNYSDKSPDKTKPVLQLLVGNENRAKIVNCGCGGVEPLSISRKSAALKRLQIEGVPFISIERSYLSHTNLKETRKATEYQNKVYVQLLEMWNCDVLFPAGRDLYCTKDEFTDIHKDVKIPVVLTNVDLKFDCNNVKKSTILDIADRRLMFLNVVRTGKGQDKYPDFEFTDPKEAVESELKSNEGKFDEAIIFADSTMEREIFSSLAAIDKILIVFGNSYDKTDDAKASEYVAIREVNKAAFLPYTMLPGDIEAVNFFGGATGDIIGFSVAKSTINANDECDETIDKFLCDENKKIGEMRTDAYNNYAMKNPDKVQSLYNADARMKSAKWAGSFACFDCHIEQAEKWRESQHSKAFVSLAAKTKSNDVECVGCHTIGFMDSGFTIDGKEARFAGVGCESCHGPGEWHRKLKTQADSGDESKDTDAIPADWIPSPGEAVCTKCHQDMHDPDFDFATKIKFVCSMG